MDFSHIPEVDRPLYQAIVQGMQELAANLPLPLRPLAGPMLAMATEKVASVSPPDLRGFIAQAHDYLGQFLTHEGETPVPVGEGQLTAALAPAPPPAPPPAAERTGQTWWDPAAQEYTGRMPTEADAAAIAAALDANPDADELNRLLAAGTIVFDEMTP